MKTVSDEQQVRLLLKVHGYFHVVDLSKLLKKSVTSTFDLLKSFGFIQGFNSLTDKGKSFAIEVPFSTTKRSGVKLYWHKSILALLKEEI